MSSLRPITTSAHLQPKKELDPQKNSQKELNPPSPNVAVPSILMSSLRPIATSAHLQPKKELDPQKKSVQKTGQERSRKD